MKFENDVEVTEWPCPYCGSKNDAASEVGGRDAKPKPGDIGICGHCGGFVEYDELGLTVKLKDYEALDPMAKAILCLMKASIELRT